MQQRDAVSFSGDYLPSCREKSDTLVVSFGTMPSDFTILNDRKRAWTTAGLKESGAQDIRHS